jgi:AAA domain
LIKGLMPAVGHGLISGQWGAGKTFAFFDLAASLNTGQPFVGHIVKRQCGVLLIAAEGADEVRLRLDAVVREKCGNMARAPFRWYETAPLLLHKGAIEKLIAMARQAEASLQQEFGLPLGLIGIDTIAACAGYAKAGDEYDNAVGQAIMNVLKAVAYELKCFVLGIDHFGKDLLAGTRGASSKESSGDVVLACLGDKQVSGAVTNTRLAVRKHRGGRQGQEYPFSLRMVEAPEKDEDGDPVTTMVVDWLPPGTAPTSSAPDDPWAKPKRQDQRTAALRLKRVLMTILAEQGVNRPIMRDGPVVRMVDQNFVRKAFYACTPADEGTPERKGHFRRQKFLRALDWAEDEQLIGITEIEGLTYLWLTRPHTESEN